MDWRHNKIVRRSLNGAASGFLATFPMNVTMLGIRKALPIFYHQKLPPYKISKRIFRKLRLVAPWENKKKKILTNVSHFGYGAAGGIAYSTFANKSDLSPAIKGTVFGLAVWVGSYFGWLPATKLLPPSMEPPKRHAMMAASHVVWGASIAYIFDRLTKVK
jgi:lipoprotein signal peptidase